MVKYHPSSNTLISKEQRGGVRNWRASEASETLLGLNNENRRYMLFIGIYIHLSCALVAQKWRAS